MIPGLGSDGAVWRRTIAAVDGKADCLVGDTLSATSLAGMARPILGHAPPRFALAGVSMGGMVALELMRLRARARDSPRPGRYQRPLLTPSAGRSIRGSPIWSLA